MIRMILAVALTVTLSASMKVRAAEDESLYNSTLAEEQAGADAVVLLKTGRLEIDRLDKSFSELRIVKKILRTRRAEEGVFSFPDSKWMKVVSIRARAVHQGGREETLTEKDIPKIPSFSDFVMYSDQSTRLVGFEGTRHGTVIDVSIRWEIESPIYWPSVQFREEIPCLDNSFTLRHRTSHPVRVTALNMDAAPGDSVEENGWRELRWSFSDIKPFEREERMPPSGQYIPTLMFAPYETQDLGGNLDISTWQGIADWYMQLSADRLKAGPRVKNMSDELGLGNMQPRDVARAIFNYVACNVRYVAVYLGLGGFQPHHAEEVAEKLYGDCKDQSTLLVTMLREAGIEAFMVLVRTADLGKLEGAAPHPGYFNHAIAAAVVDGGIVYLDPTCRVCSFGGIHSGIQGAHALHVRHGENALVTLPMEAGRGNRMETTCMINVDQEGNAEVHDVFNCAGMYAELSRAIFDRSGGESKEKAVRVLLSGDHPFAEINAVNVSGEHISSDTVRVETSYTIPGFVKDKSRVFLDAMIHGYSIGVPVGNERKFPLNLENVKSNECRVELNLPPGRKVEVVPEPLEISSNFLDYNGNWTRTPSGAVFARSFRLKTALVPAENYGEIKDMAKRIEDFENAKLLITRDDTVR